jgi:23S rRNA pseudouridine1911/1915/1917 synthase
MHDPSTLMDEGELERVLEAAEEVRTSQVPMDLHGQRLDKALAQMVPEFSRSYLQQLIEQGDALIDGRVVTKVSSKVFVL